MKLSLIYIFTVCSIFFTVQTDNYAVALKLHDQKHYKESIAICTAELKKHNSKDSLFSKFLFLRADSYNGLKNYALSINDFLTLIHTYPKNIRYYGALSFIYGEKQEYKNSLTVLNEALKIDGNDMNILNNLSYYANQTGQFEEALKYANKGLKNVKDQVGKGMLLNNRGYSYIGLGKYTYALADINESIKLFPDNSFAYCYRAIANIRLKKLSTVCADLYKAKSLGADGLTADLIKENCKN